MTARPYKLHDVREGRAEVWDADDRYKLGEVARWQRTYNLRRLIVVEGWTVTPTSSRVPLKSSPTSTAPDLHPTRDAAARALVQLAADTGKVMP